MSNASDFVIENGVLKEYVGPGGDVVIPEEVTEIGWCVFGSCHNLKTVSIPKKVSSIGQDAFTGCKSLTTVTIPLSVTGIQDGAFGGNEKLSQIIIPVTDTMKLVLDVQKRKAWKDVLGKEEFVLDLTEHEKPIGRIVVCGKFYRYIWIDSIHVLGIAKSTGIDYSAYDNFILNGSQQFALKPSGKLRAVLYRLQYPVELTDALRAEYVEFAKKNIKKLIAVASEDKNPDAVKALIRSGVVENSKKKAISKLLKESPVLEIAALADDLDSLIDGEVIVQENPASNTEDSKTTNALEQEYCSLYEKMGGEKQLRKIGIMPAQLPQVKFHGTEANAPSCMIAYLILTYAHQYTNSKNYDFTINTDADSAAALLDRTSLSDGLIALFEQINAVEHIQILPVCCRYCNAQGISHLIASFRKWDKWSDYGQRGRNAEYIGFDAMILSDTKEAVMFVDKYNRLSKYAYIRNSDPDTIRDTVLMEFGLDADGKKTYDLGSKSVVATVSKELTVELFDPTANKTIKSIPKKGTDPELVAAAASHFSDMKKNVKKAVKSRNELLFEQFLSGASRLAPAWKASYGTNALLHRVAELVVWNQDKDTFVLTENGAIDCGGNAYDIRDDIPVGVAHPIEMSTPCLLAWQRYFTSNKLKQPFAQLWEPAVRPDTVKEDRYAGFEVPLYKLKGQEKHGIQSSDGYWDDDAFAVHMEDCELDITQKEYTRHQKSWEMNADDLLVLGKFKLKYITRRSNHVIAYLDQITVNGRILRDDVTIVDDLPKFTLAQITEFIKLAAENNCSNVTALLLDYKQKTFSDFDPMEEFTLE